MHDRILRLRDVIKLTGLSRSTIYAEMAKGNFPQQLALTGQRSVGWNEKSITQWIHSRQTPAFGNPHNHP
jgi:prophage regulatory protein